MIIYCDNHQNKKKTQAQISSLGNIQNISMGFVDVSNQLEDEAHKRPIKTLDSFVDYPTFWSQEVENRKIVVLLWGLKL